MTSVPEINRFATSVHFHWKSKGSGFSTDAEKISVPQYCLSPTDVHTLSYRVSLVYSMCCGNPGLGNALPQLSEADHKCSLSVDPHVGPILSHTPLYPCLFLLYLSCFFSFFFLPPSFGIVRAEGNCGIKCSSILDHWICVVTQFIMCFQILLLFLNVKCAILFYVKILQIPICRNCSK